MATKGRARSMRIPQWNERKTYIICRASSILKAVPVSEDSKENMKVVRKIEENEFLIVKQILLTAPMEMYGEQCGESACSYRTIITCG